MNEEKILENQKRIEQKLDVLIQMLIDNQSSNNFQIFLQGLSLLDIGTTKDRFKK